MFLQIEMAATYFVDKKGDKFESKNAEKDINNLDPKIINFFLGIIEKFWSAEEAQYVTSGYFADEDDQDLGISIAKPYILSILSDKGNFGDNTKALARHLFQNSPKTSAPGLLGIFVVKDSISKSKYVCILKLRYKDEDVIKIPNDALTQLTVELVENMLISDLQKGAIIPHPTKSDYDLKVTDVVTDEPAQYFTSNFLGCRTKKSDVHQIKKLVDELESIGRESSTRVNTERLPAVIASLQEKNLDIDTALLAEVATEENLYEDEIAPELFETHFHDNVGGSLNIPAAVFSSKGKKMKPRTITFKFIGGEYDGVKVIGSPQALRNILKTEGDRAILHIETTRDGFSASYE